MCAEPDVLIDGETVVRPIEDIGEFRFLDLIPSVSFLVFVCYFSATVRSIHVYCTKNVLVKLKQGVYWYIWVIHYKMCALLLARIN